MNDEQVIAKVKVKKERRQARAKERCEILRGALDLIKK